MPITEMEVLAILKAGLEKEIAGLRSDFTKFFT
jgi:hypothetical protein